MVRQLTDEVCEPLRADLKAFLATRPDLGNPDLAAYTTLADHTVRSFVNGNIPGGNEVVSELRRVLDLAKAGAILQPGVRNGAAVIAGAGDHRSGEHTAELQSHCKLLLRLVAGKK